MDHETLRPTAAVDREPALRRFAAVAAVAALLPLLFACASGASSPPSTGKVEVREEPHAAATGQNEPDSAATLSPGHPARLAPGESARLEGSALSFRFVGVTEDSRCPRGVQCVWAGRARVTVVVLTGRDGAEKNLELEVGARDGAAFDASGRTLHAVSLAPTPEKDVRISADDYRVELALGVAAGK